jgi:hypothetical protein
MLNKDRIKTANNYRLLLAQKYICFLQKTFHYQYNIFFARSILHRIFGDKFFLKKAGNQIKLFTTLAYVL